MIKKIIVKCLYKELEEIKRKEEKIEELINTNERKIEEENEKRLIKKSIKEEKEKLKNQEKSENRADMPNTNHITEIIIKNSSGIENAQEILKKYTNVDTNILNTNLKGNYNVKIIEIEGQEENSQSYDENKDCENNEND